MSLVRLKSGPSSIESQQKCGNITTPAWPSWLSPLVFCFGYFLPPPTLDIVLGSGSLIFYIVFLNGRWVRGYITTPALCFVSVFCQCLLVDSFWFESVIWPPSFCFQSVQICLIYTARLLVSLVRFVRFSISPPPHWSMGQNFPVWIRVSVL